MKVINYKNELGREISAEHESGRSVGLVPTMGALHRGHISLVEESAKRDDLTVVSVFVNPTQFNDPADLKRYPRDLENDLRILETLPVHIVFAPPEEEMYPEPDHRTFNLDPLDKVMEGKYRPGHFNGVAQIVTKLFDAVMPDRAYFGKKDFQQLTIIRKLAEMEKRKISIVGCPIIRENDGLAMSSRNRLLTPAQRKAAPLIYATLKAAKEKQEHLTPHEMISFVRQSVNNHPLMEVEYFEIVDDQQLKPIDSWEIQANKVGCIAVQLGGIRLIDNIYFN